MAAQGPGSGYAWLDGRAARRVSDIALGATLVAVAALAIANVSGNPFRTRLDTWSFPAVVAGLLVLVGFILIIRGSFLGHRQPARWSLRALVIIVLASQAVGLAGWQWGYQIALLFGPPEYVTLIVLILTVAIALARRSRVRAAGMVLLGLLLSTVGTDVSTGVARLTMGFDELAQLAQLGARIPSRFVAAALVDQGVG